MTRVQDRANELREKAHWHISKARKLLERADRYHQKRNLNQYD